MFDEARDHTTRPAAASESGLISVVMPCFNAEKYLRAAIDSVLHQTYPQVELVIIDDGSTDGSAAIIAGYGGRVVALRSERQGPHVARNLGIEASRGEFIAFLDADDYWDARCLEKLHAALAGGDAVLAYCGWQNLGLPGARGAPFVPRDYQATDKAAAFLRAAAPWPIHAALTRREAMLAAGGFDVSYATCEDYDLWLKIAVARPIVLVPEVLAFYRHHGDVRRSSDWAQRSLDMWHIKKRFAAARPEQVAHIPPVELRRLIDGALLRRGYEAYWQRDLDAARRIFKAVMASGGWAPRDLKYLLPALLPAGLYRRLIALAGGR